MSDRNRRRYLLPALLVAAGVGLGLIFWQQDFSEAAEPNARSNGVETTPGARPEDYDGGPILIELFTSQGCSSCPPADRVLSLLRQTGQIDGIPVVTLSEHVDYWNRLGWTDPYSDALFSDRQAAYARAINRSNSMYTPQMVVDGREEFVGHNLRRATEAVRRAAARPRVPLELMVRQAGDNPGVIIASVRVRPVNSNHSEISASAQYKNAALTSADVLFAISEDQLAEQVRRGENAGHTLRHDGVIRRLVRRGPLSATGVVESGEIKLDSQWRPAHLRVVAWLEQRDTRAVLGAATAGVPAR